MEYWKWTDNNIKVYSEDQKQWTDLAKIGKLHSRYYNRSGKNIGIDVIVPGGAKRKLVSIFKAKLTCLD